MKKRKKEIENIVAVQQLEHHTAKDGRLRLVGSGERDIVATPPRGRKGSDADKTYSTGRQQRAAGGRHPGAGTEHTGHTKHVTSMFNRYKHCTCVFLVTSSSMLMVLMRSNFPVQY